MRRCEEEMWGRGVRRCGEVNDTKNMLSAKVQKHFCCWCHTPIFIIPSLRCRHGHPIPCNVCRDGPRQGYAPFTIDVDTAILYPVMCVGMAQDKVMHLLL